MATDIQAAISGNPVKNCTLITTCSWTGKYSVQNNYVQNTPTIANIENKYDVRFDDPSYYFGIGSGVVVGA